MTWTASDLTADELDALRQILDGEYLPWCPARPNVPTARAETKAKATKPTPLFTDRN